VEKKQANKETMTKEKEDNKNRETRKDEEAGERIRIRR
jgi:hypothetical protein